MNMYRLVIVTWIVWCSLSLNAGSIWAQNNYYDHGTFPTPGSAATSAGMRAEFDLIENGFAKLPQLSGNANKMVVVNGSGTALTVTNGPVRSGPALPTSAQINDLFILTTDNDATSCTPTSGGTGITLCIYTGSWIPLGGAGGGGGTSLPQQSILTNEANPLKVCRSDAPTICWRIYVQSDGLPVIRCATPVEGDCDIVTKIETGRSSIILDGNDNLITEVRPDQALLADKFVFGPNYHPRRSIWFSASDLWGDGTNCPTNPSPVTINGGPRTGTFVCSDNDGSRLYGSILMRKSWDGLPVTFTHVYVQTAADTGALSGSIVAQCRGNGDQVTNTWGTPVTILDSAVTGGNRNDMTASASITPSGTCAGGAMLYWYYALNAAATTTATATLHHVGFLVEYGVEKWSD